MKKVYADFMCAGTESSRGGGRIDVTVLGGSSKIASADGGGAGGTTGTATTVFHGPEWVSQGGGVGFLAVVNNDDDGGGHKIGASKDELRRERGGAPTSGHGTDGRVLVIGSSD